MELTIHPDFTVPQLAWLADQEGPLHYSMAGLDVIIYTDGSVLLRVPVATIGAVSATIVLMVDKLSSGS